MIRIIILVFLISMSLAAQVKETAEPILNQLSLWKPVTLEQLSLDIQNKNAAKDIVPNGNQPNFSGENLAYINQTGNYNSAIIEQNGMNNEARVSQDGNGNYTRVIQDGDDIYTNDEQKGYYNYIYQDLSGSELNYSIIQEGNFNNVVQVETNGPLKDYQVSQNGNGARLIIINGSWKK